VGLTGTSVEGRYIFAGDEDQTIPYSIDLSQASPISTYQGSAATRRLQHPNGTTFAVSHTAREIFDSTDPAKNVFQTILAMRTALASGDRAAIDAALGNLTAAGVHLNTDLSFYGTVQNKMTEAQEFGEHLQVALAAQIANLEDADLTAAILDLNQGQVQQDAALSSWSRIPRTTLFDYLG
jgi:flagellin-like hook-associated protein FlgL